MAGTRGAAGQILFTMKTMMQMMTIVPTIPYPNISGILLHGYSQHPSGQYRRTPPKTKKSADTVGTWADCDKDSVDRRQWRLSAFHAFRNRSKVLLRQRYSHPQALGGMYRKIRVAQEFAGQQDKVCFSRLED
jgi:hypothetical protein